MHISIELVPRSKEYLISQLQSIQKTLPGVNAINIPDLTRIDLRSWEGCGIAKPWFDLRIPHIRAADIYKDRPLPMLPYLVENGIDEILVVTGDIPESGPLEGCYTSSLPLISRIKKEYPHMKVYSALDPYRQNFIDEIAYARTKIDCGADGFFTQPFFDLRLMEIYGELLGDVTVFWGVSPVLTKRSHQYWISRNQAIFPNHFDCSMAWNREFARHALDFAKQRGDHIYFMPIKVDAAEYLMGIV
ncbi:MAG: methylenetetrahydrofolate reductase (NADPH) [Cellvibrionaceae bacterium]|jgi:methylenetetrahydrofolate reductase (NADPH)